MSSVSVLQLYARLKPKMMMPLPSIGSSWGTCVSKCECSNKKTFRARKSFANLSPQERKEKVAGSLKAGAFEQEYQEVSHTEG